MGLVLANRRPSLCRVPPCEPPGEKNAPTSTKLSEKCHSALERMTVDSNLTFWSRRATDHCALKFQNGLQNCCGEGVIPLLTKQRLLNFPQYRGWTEYFRVSPFVDKHTPAPVPVPTLAPTQPMPRLPTPNPTPPFENTVAAAGVIDEVITAAPSPVPTAFSNIAPPPLQTEIKLEYLAAGLAAPLAGFTLEGEGGVDLSGGESTPPKNYGMKTCEKTCTVDCTMRPRRMLCNALSKSAPDGGKAKSCQLYHWPLPVRDVMDVGMAIWQSQEAHQKDMLLNLETFRVEEDFCLPEECWDQADMDAILFAFFPEHSQFYMSWGACDDLNAGMVMMVFGVSMLLLLCILCIYIARVPPKMPTEYKVRRPDPSDAR